MSFFTELIRKQIKFLAKLYYELAKPDARKGNYIPVSGKILGEEEMSNMIDATLDMWLTTGRFNKQFEKDFAKYLGSKYALTTTSGSSANLLALTALTSHKLGEKRLKKGDEVITVAAGFPTTVNPIVQNGLIPVFVDVEIGTYNIDIDKIEKSITPKTKAIFLAHTLGNVFDIEKIKEICDKHNLWLIEDNCDALGAEYNGQKVGTFGHIGTYSFYPAHHITMGEGGAVCTNNTELYRIIKSYRDWGRDCWCEPGHDDTCKQRFNMQLGKLPFGYDHKYTYSHLGYNLKITDWQAACGLAQLKKIDKYIEIRNRNFNYLYEKLKKFEDFLILPKLNPKVKPSWFGFLISVKENAPFNKIELVKFLEENKIGTRQLFAGNLLRQPLYTDDDISLRIENSEILNSKNLTETDYKKLPNTDFVMNSTFWIGVYPALEINDLNIIVSKINEFIKKHKQ